MPVLTLTKPVTFGDQVLAQITLREPTGKDLRTLGLPIGGDGLDTTVMAAWISQLSEQAPPVVDMLCLRDWLAASSMVAGFFPQPPPPKP